ncbi:MAG: protein-disulfide reductase DsbD family protein [Planctomycetota bacterium]|nr:protein-disulfide reductase DsbD family protein [Planctomycetota bacterium]
MHFLQIACLWLLALFAPAAAASPAQFGAQAPKAKLELFTRAEAGEVRAVVRIKITANWHLYHTDLGSPDAVGRPSVLTLAGEGIEWGAARWPAPGHEEQNFGTPVKVNIHEGTVLVYARGKLAEGADGSTAAVALEGQTCETGGTCIIYKGDAKTQGAGADTLFADFPADLAGPGQAVTSEDAAEEDEFEGFEDPDAHARVELFTRAVDGEARAAIRIEIDDTWHLFHKELGPDDAVAKPTAVELSCAGVEWGELYWPEPHKAPQEYGSNGEPTWVWQHEGTIVLYARGKLGTGADLAKAHVEVTGQTCDPRVCDQFRAKVATLGAGPDTLFAKFPAAGASTSGTAGGSTASAPDAPAGDAPKQESGLLEFLGLAVFWGVFSLLMPCTYPMIPITIAFFTKQSSQSKGKRLTLSALYGFGIVLMFVLIGVLVGGPIVKFATHPTTNLVIGTLFVVFSLSLMGLFNLEPPQFLMGLAGRARSTGGYLGVFFMGATLVITSFTCTAPFVGSLLSVGASSGNWERIALGMGTFGLTMALPFVALSMVPGRVASMPRAGEWMNTLKITLGFVELAAALKFFSNADLELHWQSLPRELFLAIWLAIFVVTALYLLGMIRYHGESGEIGAGRLLVGSSFLALATYCGYGMLGYQLDVVMTAIVPPYSAQRVEGASQASGGGGAPQAVAGHVVVLDDLEAAIERAKQEKKLVMINFTGHLCVSCRAMELNIFPRPHVQDVLREHYVEARIHVDDFSTPGSIERATKLQDEIAGARATPYYLAFDPVTRKVLGRHEGPDLPPIGDGTKFAEFLNRALH